LGHPFVATSCFINGNGENTKRDLLDKTTDLPAGPGPWPKGRDLTQHNRNSYLTTKLQNGNLPESLLGVVSGWGPTQSQGGL
jgi:hypothetical protein